jgi:hypothetical protein
LKGENKMNKDIKKEIEEYVLSEIKHLRKLNRQQDEYEKTTSNSVDNIKTLVELLQKEDVNINNINLENRKINISEIKNNNDVDIKNKEIKLNSKRDIEIRNDRLIKILVDGAVVLVPIIFYNVWMNKGFKFEETGTFTSSTFKNLFGKFKPTK